MKWQSAERCANDDWLKPLKKIKKKTNHINLSSQWLIYWISLVWKVTLTFISYCLVCALIRRGFNASALTSPRRRCINSLQQVRECRRLGHCRSTAGNWQILFRFGPRNLTLSYRQISMLLFLYYKLCRKKDDKKSQNSNPPSHPKKIKDLSPR